MVGKAVVLGNTGAAEVKTTVSGAGYIIGGIPFYTAASDGPNIQTGVCVLMKKGQTYVFRVGDGGKFEQMKTVNIVWA